MDQGSMKPLGLSRQSVAGIRIRLPGSRLPVAVAKLWGQSLVPNAEPRRWGMPRTRRHARAIPGDKLMA